MWCLAAAPAMAQPLAQFLSSAERANLDARTGAQARERAEAEFAQAWGGLLPSLTASGGWTHNQYDAVLGFPTGATSSTTVVIVPKNQLDATFKAEVPLLAPSRWLETAAASSSARAAVRRDQSTREQVHRQVVSAFYAYLGARAVLESAQRSLALSQAQVEVTAARTAAGVANELELMRGRAEVERNQQLVADAESLVATGARTLETLSGLSPGEVPPLPLDSLEPVPPLEPLLARGVDGRPAVQAADEDVTAASRTSAAATLALVPSVNAQFTQRFTNATGFQDQSALSNAGLTFSWRLDVPAVAGLRALRAGQETALIAAERARRQAADQLHADWQKAKASVKKVSAARAQVAAARRASSLAHERNLAGVATQLDVIQSERDLFSAELGDIQASAELASARALLAISAGEPLQGAGP
ncbi:MAG: TolC family protein [Archangium sp.]|nr:TolC family protein [Archangium sp.]